MVKHGLDILKCITEFLNVGQTPVLQSWPKTMWTVAFDQLFKQKCKIYRSFFNPPAPLNNVVLQYVV